MPVVLAARAGSKYPRFAALVDVALLKMSMDGEVIAEAYWLCRPSPWKNTQRYVIEGCRIPEEDYNLAVEEEVAHQQLAEWLDTHCSRGGIFISGHELLPEDLLADLCLMVWRDAQVQRDITLYPIEAHTMFLGELGLIPAPFTSRSDVQEWLGLEPQPLHQPANVRARATMHGVIRLGEHIKDLRAAAQQLSGGFETE